MSRKKLGVVQVRHVVADDGLYKCQFTGWGTFKEAKVFRSYVKARKSVEMTGRGVAMELRETEEATYKNWVESK